MSEDARHLTVAINELIGEVRLLRGELGKWSRPVQPHGGITISGGTACSHRFITSEHGTVRCTQCGLDLGSTAAAQT